MSNQTQETFEWLGFILPKYFFYGIGILLFSIAYIGINEAEKSDNSIYKKAKPISQKQEGLPIYATGKLIGKPIGNPFLKEGNYIKIKASSKAFAWEEYEVHTKSGTPRKNYFLSWMENPQDPKSFADESQRNHPFIQKKVQLQDVYDPDFKILSESKEYKIHVPDLEFHLLEKGMIPKTENLILDTFHIVQADPNNPEQILLYENEKCAKEPEEGCQQIILSVYVNSDKDYTLIGNVEGDQIKKLNGTIKISEGDLSALLENFSFGTSFGNFFTLISQFFAFLGVWFAIYTIKDSVVNIIGSDSRLVNLGTFKFTFTIALGISIVSALLKVYSGILGILLIGIILYYSRNRKTV